MPAVYPLAVKNFLPKTDNIDTVYAAHVNDLQNEVSAVENILGRNPHQYAGYVPIVNVPYIWPPRAGVVDLNTPSPFPAFGRATTYPTVGARLTQIESQVAWVSEMTRLLIGKSGTKWKPPAAAIRAPGMKVPAGEGAWVAFQWGAEDYDSDNMFQGGTNIVCPVTGFWDISASVWCDSTVRKANDLHFVHVRMLRDGNEIAGQDSLIETQTWIRHRINLSWQGRLYQGSTIRLEVSQHGASDPTVDSNAYISLSFVRDLG